MMTSFLKTQSKKKTHETLINNLVNYTCIGEGSEYRPFPDLR